mmetsp:Transcript_6929/g.12970  ORF Transcript_6929/g.12970 Transcript_6929/m.12970 type:complete len:324 (-) Transcript_6929:372-1343(-)
MKYRQTFVRTRGRVRVLSPTWCFGWAGSVFQGSTPFCKAHGGGKRCSEAGCSRSARGNTTLCVAHTRYRQPPSAPVQAQLHPRQHLQPPQAPSRLAPMVPVMVPMMMPASYVPASGGGGPPVYWPVPPPGWPAPPSLHRVSPSISAPTAASSPSVASTSAASGRREDADAMPATEGPPPRLPGLPVMAPPPPAQAPAGALHSWKIALPKGKGPARPSRGSHMCVEEGCSKYSVVGAVGDTTRCIAHGGGKRCQAQGCSKSAVGSTDHCIAHGGGKRCKLLGCTKAARGSTHFCITHGGGKRCLAVGCMKVVEGSTAFCVNHGE